mmetsp:Transcript_134605/g.238135  ORF Transcript_134605/g.238135 Transcript_134605/m.238135 type:complete len:92 (+) Transcript_134605:1-276(+)
MSDVIGFSSTFDSRNASRLPMSGASGELVPKASCWSSARQQVHLTRCFAFRHTKLDMPGKAEEKCPDPTFNWFDSPFNPANRGHDLARVRV